MRLRQHGRRPAARLDAQHSLVGIGSRDPIHRRGIGRSVRDEQTPVRLERDVGREMKALLGSGRPGEDALRSARRIHAIDRVVVGLRHQEVAVGVDRDAARAREGAGARVTMAWFAVGGSAGSMRITASALPLSVTKIRPVGPTTTARGVSRSSPDDRIVRVHVLDARAPQSIDRVQGDVGDDDVALAHRTGIGAGLRRRRVGRGAPRARRAAPSASKSGARPALSVRSEGSILQRRAQRGAGPPPGASSGVHYEFDIRVRISA